MITDWMKMVMKEIFYWWNEMKIDEMKWNEMKWSGMKWNEVEWNGVGCHKTCEMRERGNFFGKYRVSGVPDFHPTFSV